MACGKIILFGEHAVVYAKPGIAVPVEGLRTFVNIEKNSRFWYDTNVELTPAEQTKMDMMFNVIFESLDVSMKVRIQIESDIPKGSGLGSSAALCVSVIRGLDNFYKLKLSKEKINEIAFDCEKVFHGNPSGIDNSVVVFERPLYFQGGNIEYIDLQKSITLLIADSGIKSDTKKIVDDVKAVYDSSKETTLEIFDDIEMITIKAKSFLEQAQFSELGELMYRNHLLLQDLTVSRIELDEMVRCAMEAGAYGAKLCGAGRGGNIAALVDRNNLGSVKRALKKVSKNIIETKIR